MSFPIKPLLGSISSENETQVLFGKLALSIFKTPNPYAVPTKISPFEFCEDPNSIEFTLL